MSKNAPKIGWIGVGRMGTPMVERLLKAGHDVTIWNRTRAKAEPDPADLLRSLRHHEILPLKLCRETGGLGPGFTRSAANSPEPAA